MKLMVLDGNSIVNRAFYGIRLLTTRDGTPTNGVYGFLTILNKLMAEEMPDALCVTFDLSAPTFRHEQFAGYKAQRKAMPDELAAQMPVLKKVLDAMRIPRYELEGWEADDLIGTIARKCEENGWECTVVTGDRDSLQLVTETTHVSLVRTRMGQNEYKEYTVPSFTGEYGFEPEKMVDLKALMGDASDNIPGVPGVGEKTALDLVRRFGSVEDIYGGLDALDIKEGVRKKLDAGRESAAMSYKLATIRRDAPIEFSPKENMCVPVDNNALYMLFQKLEFSRLTERFGLKPPDDAVSPGKKAAAVTTSTAVKTAKEAADMLFALEGVERVAVRHDETFSEVVLADYSRGAAYILRKGETEGYESVLRGVFGSKVQKAGHEIKDTQRRLLEMGLPAGGWVTDTAVAAYLLSPTDSAYDLPRLTERYCGFSMKSGGEDGDGQLSMLDGAGMTEKLVAESAAIGALSEELEPQLTAYGMDKLYREIELPLCTVLAEMEESGFLVDREALTGFGEMLSLKIGALEREIYALSGEEFNINSPKQLSAILFDKLMLPAPKKTKTGYSTNIEVLEQLRGKHPVIGLLMEYRELAKLKTTYADGLIKVIAPDGRIHTNFQMTVTATGRLSSTEPNLQNIPIRKELGGEIRKMFVAGEGCVLVDADYSQIELRLLADISGDETMRDAFMNGEDIHAVTASQVFGTPLEDVTPTQRSRAKAVNFGIVYGISAFSLAQDIGVTVAEARFYIDSYLAKYKGVRAYMKDIVEKAKNDGYCTTLFGRRRYLPELKSSNHNTRSFGERVALNTPIQGTAADVIKLAMVNVAKRIRREGLKAQLILQVHDELIAECPEDEQERVTRLLEEEMENAVSLSVPLKAEAHAGKSWSEAK